MPRNTIPVLLAILTLWSGHANADFLPVCARTEPVKNFIEKVIKKTCDNVTEADLLTIERISVSRTNIKQFQADDFSGLGNLKILNIRSNPYTSLPEGLLKDLGNLETLVIIATSLESFPEDFLEYNPKIHRLHAFRNKVRKISDAVLKRLANARELEVIDMDRAIEPESLRTLQSLFPKGGHVNLILH